MKPVITRLFVTSMTVCVTLTVVLAWVAPVRAAAEAQGPTAVEKARQQAFKILKEGEAVKPDQPSRDNAFEYQKSHITITPAPPIRRDHIKRPDFFATVKGNGFYVDGKRVFLLGAESFSTLYPYLYKLMGIDFVQMQDTSAPTAYEHKGENWHVSWQADPYVAVEIRRLLRHHLLPDLSVVEGRSTRNKLFDQFPRLFAERGHFLNYSPLNPLGEKLRWNGREAVMSGLGDLPVWMWELFNEVSYRCHDQWNLAAFHRWAHEHYGTIEAANKVWGTDFGSFSEVVPPNPGYGAMVFAGPLVGDASTALFRDFMKSQEIVFGKYLERSQRKMQGLDPLALVTVQSHSNLMLDYGATGVNPLLKALGEDVYGDESGGQALFIQGENDPVEIGDMLTEPMIYDIVRAAAGDRPILGSESSLQGRGGPKLDSRVLADLKGTWQFLPLQGNPSGEGVQPPGPDAQGWTTIHVPGIWGKQGFADTQVAWYRHTFTLPARSVLKKGEILRLKGEQLTDRATLYLNGHKIHTTGSWSEAFAMNITQEANWGGNNDLVIRIENHYLSGGYYWGGIRRYVRVVVGQPPHPQPMTAGQMRTWIWNKAIHGLAGSVLSYFYRAEASGASPLFSPRYQLAAQQAVAPANQLINNLASIVLTDPVRGRVAMIYPVTSLRPHHRPKGEPDYRRAMLTPELAKYYAALLFTHASMDMVLDEALENIGRYKALVVAMEPFITPQTLEKLEKYVRQGGVLMVSADSLVTNEDLNAPLGEIAWLPDRNHTGTDQAGRSVGKGHVYMLPAWDKSTLPELRSLVDTLLKRSGIEPALTVKATGEQPASCVEGQSFTGEEGRTVWYLLNWGATCEAVVGSSASAFKPGETYRVRNAAARELIPSPTGRDVWTAEQLRQGIAMTIPCQDPRLILIEPSSMDPLGLPRISPELRRDIQEAFSPTIESDHRILFSTQLYELMTPVRIPTAEKALERTGWGVYAAVDRILGDKKIDTWGGRQVTPRMLSDFQILVFSCPQGNVPLAPQTVEAVKQYVANGGGLLLLANPPHGPHGWLAPNNINKLTAMVGVKIPRYIMARDTRHNRHGQPLLPILGADIADHPVTAGVKTFDPDGTGVLKLDKDSPAKVVIRTNATSDPANAPVMAVAKYGKGRVVIMGSGYWLEPTIFDNADNQRLLSNIIAWLAPRRR